MSHCLLCDSNSIKKIEAAQPGPYYHCPVCDLIFLEPKMRLERDEERARYEQHNNTPDNSGYVAMFEMFLDAVLPYVPGPVRALDYGCGPGPVLQWLLQRKGINTDVYDPYFAPVLPPGPYGLITSTEALEHVFHPKEAWQAFLRLLDKSGILAVMTHLHSGPTAFANWWYRRDSTHVVFYSEKTFVWVAKAFGFSVLFNDGSKTVVLRKL